MKNTKKYMDPNFLEFMLSNEFKNCDPVLTEMYINMLYKEIELYKLFKPSISAHLIKLKIMETIKEQIENLKRAKKEALDRINYIDRKLFKLKNTTNVNKLTCELYKLKKLKSNVKNLKNNINDIFSTSEIDFTNYIQEILNALNLDVLIKDESDCTLDFVDLKDESLKNRILECIIDFYNCHNKFDNDRVSYKLKNTVIYVTFNSF